MSYAIAYLVATAIFLLIDAIWLGVVAKNFYANQLGYLMADDIRFGVAAAFYAVYTIGIIVFAIKPGMNADSLLMVAGYSALFGFLAYGTYDFTNLATIKDWPVIVSVVDIIWGTTITTVTGVATYLILKKFGVSI